ncbi:class II glutamine amidotransferase [Stygiolobus caldivivus]|uniref:Glutamine amidotransferase n=1 Tax=Stygiolobus caldivivus TaxID=2824673 RepID=A0A8D5U5K7_9CREN|nr:class II glutamine amidotransferase [Stygiolobus caldivivus]BCU69412.1 glutamine amidotransferase [Stygiolobus caldivivus]
MCRLLAFNTKERVDTDVIRAFVDAARNDVYFRYVSHSHGWGIAAIVEKEGKQRIIYYKSVEPIYEDDMFYNIVESLKGNRIIGIVHARKAGKEFLIGLRHNHPYHLKIRSHDLYFAHNGSINRKAFEHPDYPSTDSYLFFLELVKNVENSPISIEKAYSKLILELGRYSSSLNSALLTFNEVEGPEVYFAHYYNKERIKEIEEYYRVYRYGDYVFSSTIAYYLGKKVESVELGSVIRLSND